MIVYVLDIKNTKANDFLLVLGNLPSSFNRIKGDEFGVFSSWFLQCISLFLTLHTHKHTQTQSLTTTYTILPYQEHKVWILPRLQFLERGCSLPSILFFSFSVYVQAEQLSIVYSNLTKKHCDFFFFWLLIIDIKKSLFLINRQLVDYRCQSLYYLLIDNWIILAFSS